ncbi:high affinity immunoglobulin epsilon receptor subunit gamma-like [Megalops cyprinoides]|uniref:high affinity immunoglobulin epsilon receptor subunit gamma-like n=1 Tax=Megalops cyprinoides TaxID=118141 RepID=UPI0018653806|nr:high affinity immunoglobulin epsilon receptor subunit gamma-like [Megalops cyprinoides]
MKGGSLFLATLLLSFSSAAALEEGKICYILDGILFVYGIVLTVLYCRLKMGNSGSVSEKPQQGEGVYAGLAPHAQDTYETIGQKKGMV